jgi:uncharacterized protein YheU (UPF0270 family)
MQSKSPELLGVSDLDDAPCDPVMIPHAALAADLLRKVVEAFVLREGTDYGEKEFSLDEKVAHVLRQLERGEAQIIFDPNSKSVDVVVSGATRPPRR